mmetsp:Transcript_71341/g.148937  ORF Transcript_71341/g.148937 Transcript_71341/m.148937 type:complete len:200 (-) Transcript_71341:921-1520(-)
MHLLPVFCCCLALETSCRFLGDELFESLLLTLEISFEAVSLGRLALVLAVADGADLEFLLLPLPRTLLAFLSLPLLPISIHRGGVGLESFDARLGLGKFRLQLLDLVVGLGRQCLNLVVVVVSVKMTLRQRDGIVHIRDCQQGVSTCGSNNRIVGQFPCHSLLRIAFRQAFDDLHQSADPHVIAEVLYRGESLHCWLQE